MTAAIQASSGLLAAASFSYALTVANNGGAPGRFGYAPAEATNPGAIAPITTFRGTTIGQITANTSSNDLVIVLNATGLTQSRWRMVVVQGTDNVWRTYLAASATFSDSGAFCSWLFGTGSSPVWTSTASPRGVVFFL